MMAATMTMIMTLVRLACCGGGAIDDRETNHSIIYHFNFHYYRGRERERARELICRVVT